MVFRAGTYVAGMRAPISASGVSFGTATSAVRAEPPKARRSRSHDHVPPDAEPLGHPPGRLELDRVPLAVAHAEGVHVEPLVQRDRRGGGRIHPAAQQENGLGKRHPER